MAPFPFYQQLNAMDCGPTCLRMVAKFYGKSISLNTLRIETQINKDGVNLLGISEAAEKIGFRTRGVKISLKELIDNAPKPVILHWHQNHFIVLPSQKFKANKIVIADPARGIIKISIAEFISYWISTGSGGGEKGIALILEPTPAFFHQKDEHESKVSWNILFGYLKQQKKFIIQLLIGLLVGSLLQIIFPFLT